MKKYDIIIIGGSAAGLTAGITVKRHYPEKSVLLIRKEKQVLIPCGIPYIFGTVGSPDKNLIPDAALDKNNIELLVKEVIAINREEKTVSVSDDTIQYDRLILAAGSEPVIPGVPGSDKEGVYAIHKNVDYLNAMQKKVEDAKNIVIIGGGFIGIEFADEVNRLGAKSVTVVEIADHCLNLAYDEEFCIEMEDKVKARGIQLKTSTKVEAIEGNGRVESIRRSDGSALPADLVILGIGAKPNIELAEKSGLRIGRTGAIIVDRTMKTSDDSIFACGDCAKKWAFFGGRPSTLKLASIATLEARIAGANLFGITRENAGTVGVWSTAVGDLAMGTAGLTENAAKAMGYNIVSATIEGPNRHPGGMPGMKKSRLKMVFEFHSGLLLGGQISGDAAAGEVINIISACVQSRMTAEQIAMFQTGTHPALTASPIAYPLVNAAELAIKQMNA
jgi:NADH oxidase (H2O2-forming)